MPDSERPNVLILVPHDLGDTLHCYGHEQVRSPNLDRMAERGVSFTNYFCVSPECTSSRSGMLTGFHPHQNGLMGLANFGWELCVPHLAQRMREIGYATHLFTYQHETAGSPGDLGYDHIHKAPPAPDGHRRHNAASVCKTVADFLGSNACSEQGPWFACAGFSDVHRKWKADTAFDEEAMVVPPYLPDNAMIRRDLAQFYQAIEDMDAAVGCVLDSLEQSPQRDNTLVIFTTDHGPGFPRAKATLYDPGLRIPLILRLPERIEGGRVHPQLLSNVDLTPTLLELCGSRPPDEMTGRSFASLLTDRPYRARDAVFSSLFYDVTYDPMHCVRTHAHKYIRSFAVTEEDASGADPEVLATHVAGQWIRVDDFDVMSSPAWQSMKGEYPKPPREELYDLRKDPWEQRNLANDPAAADALKEMRRRLDEWMERTGSPLRNGGHVVPSERQKEATRQYRPGGPRWEQVT